jgi:hypothetical protein
MLLVAALPALSYDYKGPKPPKQDLPYLVHADKLIPTDAGEANEESSKRGTLYVLAGASASARTPVPEPIFVIDVKTIDPEKLSVYPFKVVNGRRELLMPTRPKDAPRPIKKSVKKLGGGLFVFELAELLPPGEYGLSPDGSNAVFAFQVF